VIGCSMCNVAISSPFTVNQQLRSLHDQATGAPPIALPLLGRGSSVA
jgi:hypothetical protein